MLNNIYLNFWQFDFTDILGNGGGYFDTGMKIDQMSWKY